LIEKNQEQEIGSQKSPEKINSGLFRALKRYDLSISSDAIKRRFTCSQQECVDNDSNEDF